MMWRWGNRIFLLIALMLLLWVFAQDRNNMFHEMQRPEKKSVATPKPQEAVPTTMPPQEQVEVPVIETKPAKKPVQPQIQPNKAETTKH